MNPIKFDLFYQHRTDPLRVFLGNGNGDRESAQEELSQLLRAWHDRSNYQVEPQKYNAVLSYYRTRLGVCINLENLLHISPVN